MFPGGKKDCFEEKKTYHHCKIGRSVHNVMGCFAASGTKCLKSVQVTKKSEDKQDILKQIPSVRKLYLRQSKITTQSKHLREPKNGWKKGIALFWRPAVIFGFESKRPYMERTETHHWEKEPIKPKTMGAICWQRVGQIDNWEVFTRARESFWLQLLPQMLWNIRLIIVPMPF